MEPTVGTELMAVMVLTERTVVMAHTVPMAPPEATARTGVMVVTERTAVTGEVQPSKRCS